MIDIVIEGYEDIVNRIDTMNDKAAKVVNRTIGDFRSRGPGWVSKEVVKEYNIKKKDVNETEKRVKNVGKIKIGGASLDSLEVRYKGRLLTPTHFSMKPTEPVPWYECYRNYKEANTVTVKIKKKGARKTLSDKAFLVQPRKKEDSPYIPFQRIGRRRLPVHVIKTLSVPQMITNETVNDNIYQRIDTELGKRFKHNLERMMNK